MMAQKDPVAAAARKYKPIQSAVPGTTLGPIQIDAFLGGGKLFDTPGVHLHHRQAAVVHSEDLPSLAPQSRLRGQSFPVASDKRTQIEMEANCLNGFTIFWGGLVRIDVLKVLLSTRLTFYGPKSLQIHMVPTTEADEFYQKELGVLLTPPTGKQRADNWVGLQAERQLQIKFEDQKRPACDVAISGLGWITVEPISKALEISDSSSEENTRELYLSVHVPKPVEIFVRPSMPVGKAGGEWYEYRELTEKEEENNVSVVALTTCSLSKAQRERCALDNVVVVTRTTSPLSHRQRCRAACRTRRFVPKALSWHLMLVTSAYRPIPSDWTYRRLSRIMQPAADMSKIFGNECKDTWSGCHTLRSNLLPVNQSVGGAAADACPSGKFPPHKIGAVCGNQ
ncbi:hypothetical protein HHK36_027999 [Tetracentron sinense]|uniref:NOA1/YqeH-like C-terminal domain-containing protein n=1 Tax=Tetracentron sinense TaxID=13715 RepID=A0A835D1K1_TETSI|nr:hypothetical protein HHK36_027999 [Tetracentron sinense]